ncbi:MAG: hypothetical protein EU529_17250 [Promethearchaeota archaeon]|nr:MAG: hypothetical protein EU529_17250 [Candidatus Lokiarchaeota archaeon]
MKELEKISDDPKSLKRIGRYKDKKGFSLHGIFKRTYSKTQDILFINNGYLMARYKYPRIKPKFNSPMLNAFNLHLCGGWRWTNMDVKKEILNRVIKGLKPMGDIVDKSGDIVKISEILEKEGVTYKITPHSWKGHENIRFCRNGKIEEIFDIEALLADYCDYYATIVGEFEDEYQNFMLKISDHKLSDFLNFNISTPELDSDVIITGLILGYPVWSTVYVMWM